MSENSKIEWTDHTFNAWHGCQKVSAGCKNCYAETLDNRWKGGHWGPGSDRKPMSEKYWAQPLKWNDAAAKAGTPAKVFCASMADVFEDHPQVHGWRDRLFALIERTPWLIWQLLTKRPENIMHFLPARWIGDLPFDGMPKNIWFGTSVENQEAAEERIPHLMQVPAAVKFLSCEPLLGPVDLSDYYFKRRDGSYAFPYLPEEARTRTIELIGWVIVGGESGPCARPMHPDWARSLRDQCHAAGVPFFFKQWGEYLPFCQHDWDEAISWKEYTFPSPHNPHKKNSYFKAGKKAAGHLLDEMEWNEFPTSNIQP